MLNAQCSVMTSRIRVFRDSGRFFEVVPLPASTFRHISCTHVHTRLALYQCTTSNNSVTVYCPQLVEFSDISFGCQHSEGGVRARWLPLIQSAWNLNRCFPVPRWKYVVSISCEKELAHHKHKGSRAIFFHNQCILTSVQLLRFPNIATKII
jgi:hypothetical protein